jgi:hypothetical protein
VWGGIGGTLANQPDLVSALAGKDALGAAAGAQAASLQKSANLSDLQNAATARINIGLGSAAIQNASAFDVAGATASRAGTGNCPANQFVYQVGTGTPVCAQVSYSQLANVPTTGGGISTTAVSIPLGPMFVLNGYGAGISMQNWGLAQDYGGGGNVPMAYIGGGFFNAVWQFSSSLTNAIGRWIWLPADWDNTQPITVTFDFGPDAASGSGNFGLKVAIGCVTPGTTTFAATYPAINAYATTGAISVSSTQYMHEQATTGALTMTGCVAGSLAKLVALRDVSVSGNSGTTLDLLDARLNYTRR